MPFLDPAGLAGARIGVATQYAEGHEAVEAVFQTALDAMRDAGATVVEVPPVAGWRQMGRPSNTLMRYEFKADLNAYLAALGPDAPVKSLEEVIAFNASHPELEMPYFQQEVLLEAQALGTLEESAYKEALSEAVRLSRTEGTDKVLSEHRLDAIVAPTGSPAWTTDLINGDHYYMGSSSPAAIAGYPAVTVPMGSVQGLPVNVSFWGGAWQEPQLIRIAYAFEQYTGHRLKPLFIPTLDL